MTGLLTELASRRLAGVKMLFVVRMLNGSGPCEERDVAGGEIGCIPRIKHFKNMRKFQIE